MGIEKNNNSKNMVNYSRNKNNQRNYAKGGQANNRQGYQNNKKYFKSNSKRNSSKINYKGKRNQNFQENKPLPSVKVSFLGGLNEIGKNITLFECEDEIIVIDCGMAFPDGEMLGVGLVIPDFTYLVQNKDKVKAITARVPEGS